MAIKKIQCVTFPRSGHRFLMHCLETYFQKDFHYCEFYHCCKKIPCIHPETNFQKNHDFNVNLINNPSGNYIIQYRHPFESLISWYTVSTRLGWKRRIKEDRREEWEFFFSKHILFWKKFIHKWVLDNNNPNTYYLPYSDLVNNFKIELEKVITFINPEKKVDRMLICDMDNEIDTSTHIKVVDFRFYDLDFFRKMEELVCDELKSLHLKLL